MCWFALLLAACLPSAEQLQRDYVRASCERLFECQGEEYAVRAGFETQAACEEWLYAATVGDEGDCLADREATADCIDEIEAETCAEWASGELPPACDGLCGG